MNIGGLVGALVPVFFVLALGFFAGKRNADGQGWTVTQSSGNTDSLKVYVYCA